MKGYTTVFFAIIFLCVALGACKMEKKQRVITEPSEKETPKSKKEVTDVLKDNTVVMHDGSKDAPSNKNSTEIKSTFTKTALKTEVVSTKTDVPEMSSALPQHAKEKVEKVTKPKAKDVQIETASVPDPIKKEDPTTKIEKQTKNKTDKLDTQMEEEPIMDEDEAVTPNKIDHSSFDTFLSSFVNAKGVVNYKGMLNKKAELVAYTEDLKNNYPASDDSKNSKLAYFMNAYNAFTLLLILENYPLASIMDLDGGKPWDRKWIKLGQKTLSLNDIEHGILRKELKEPRVHFAVNCAAKSCPPLYNRAFTESNVQSLLEQRTKAFINDESQNSLTGKTLELSKIFDWYKEDFGDLISYINKYRDSKVPSDTKITFKEYDWKLNE